MITELTISHFKSIDTASLRLHRANVIVGPNGSGKSNIVDAIRFLSDCARDDIDTAVTRRHGIDSIRQWSRTRPYNLTLEVKLKSDIGEGGYQLILSSNKGAYRILEEKGFWTGPHPREIHRKGAEVKTSRFKRSESGEIGIFTPFDDMKRTLRVDTDSLFLSALGQRLALPPYILFRPIARELLGFSAYAIYPNTLRQAQLASREPVLLEDGSNLASILKRINSNRRFARDKDNIVSGLKQIMPSATDFQVRSAAGFFVPVIRVEEVNGEVHDFNLSQISDGTLRVLGLLTAFYQPAAPEIVAVEEPEQMIHPGALPIISEAVADFTRRRPTGDTSQVFVTTHSPPLLDLFDPKFVLWAKFEDGVTKCGPVSKRQLQLIKDQLFSPGEILTSEGFFS